MEHWKETQITGQALAPKGSLLLDLPCAGELRPPGGPQPKEICSCSIPSLWVKAQEYEAVIDPTAAQEQPDSEPDPAELWAYTDSA